MKRKIISLILALAFFLGALTFYINTVTIPKDLKRLVIQETQKFLGRKVSLQGIHFNPFTGFVFNGIILLEKGSPDVFATIDRVRVHVLYWPFLRHQKVILSSVELTGVSLNLIHFSGGQWNFLDIIEHRSHNAKQQALKIYLSRLVISKGYLKITDLEDGFQFSQVFDPTDVTLNLSFSKGLTFQASTFIPDQEGALEINGHYMPSGEKLAADIHAKNLALKPYIRLIGLQMPFTLDDLSVRGMDIRMAIEKRLSVSGDVDLGAFALHTGGQNVSLKALAAKGINFGFIDGEAQCTGHLLAEGLNVLSQGHFYSAGAIDVQVDEWTSHGQSFSTAGSVHTTMGAFEIPGQLSLKGDVHLKGIRLERDPNALNADGAFELTNTSLAVGQEIHMNGNFSSPAFAVTDTPQATIIKGNLYADNLFYQWPGKELRGQVAMTNILINRSPQTPWTVQSDVRGQGLDLKLPRGNTLTTDVIGQTAMEYAPKEKTFQIKSTYQLSGGTFALANGVTITGSPSGDAIVSSKTDPSKPVPYKGSMEFTDGAMQGTKIGPIDKIQGTVAFENNLAKTSNLNFHALGMPARLTGALNDFSAPMLDVLVRLKDFDLAFAKDIIPDVLQKNQLSLTGIAPVLDITYKGPLAAAKDADISFDAIVHNASVTSDKLKKTASNVSGGVAFHGKILSWNDLHAQYEQKPYVLTGSIMPSLNPIIETSVEAKNLKLKTKFEYAPDSITFQQLIGHYKNAVFNVQGTTKTTVSGGRFVDLTGEADLDLNNLTEIFPGVPEGIRNCRLAGMTHIAGSFTGDPAHWQDWQFNLTGASPKFSIWGLTLDNMKFNAVQKNNLLKPFHMWGEFYGGDLNVLASVDTAKKELPFEVVARMIDSDLNKLRKDTPLKKESLAGTLSATGILDGRLTELTALNGKGGISIKDGRLWELDLLKGLGGILLIPEYKDIVFTQAGMNFTMTSGVMSTENIQLLGPSLDLFGKGTLDFTQDQALNLLLTPDFNTDVIVGSSSLKKGTTAIITGTEKFMSVNVTGTLKKPQYKVNNSTVKILQKTGGVILENVSQFFQNIF